MLAKLYGISLDDLLRTDQEEFESGNNQAETEHQSTTEKKKKVSILV